MPQTVCSMAWVVVTGLSPWRPKSDPGLVHVRRRVDKVVLGQVSLLVLPLSHLSIIPPLLLPHHHFNTTEKRTSIWSFEPSNIVVCFCMFGNINQKSTFTLYFVLEWMKLSYCGQGRVNMNIMTEDSISILW